MNPMVQGLVGAGISLVAFAAGVGVGRSGTAGSTSGSREVRVVMPDRMRLELSGIASDRAACLDWVSAHFKEPNVGQFAMMCGTGSQ